jgi:hypothetical protein
MERNYREDRALNRLGGNAAREGTGARPPTWVGWSMWVAIVAFTVVVGILSFLESST